MAGGQQINVGQGTVVYGEATDETVTGSAATSDAGTQAPGTVIRLRSRKVGGGTSSFLLTGQFSSVQQETPVKQVSALLATPALAGSQGAFGKTRARALSGSQISGAQQTIGPAASLGFTIQRTGVKYSVLQDAINASIAGDTITGAPGTYASVLRDPFDNTTYDVRVTKNLTIKSSVTGQKVVIDASNLSRAGGTGVMTVYDGVSLTLEDFELKNNKPTSSDYNPGLYMRIDVGTVILRRCKISECGNGIFNSNQDTTCNLTLEDCELVDNGTSSGFYHHMYIGSIASLTMRGCWIHNSKSKADYVALYGPGNEYRESGGHLVKTRSRVTLIEGCRLTMEWTGTAPDNGGNRCIDASNGGELTVRGCLLEYRTYQNGGQLCAIGWGAEGSANLPGRQFEVGRLFKVNIQQNTIVGRSPFQTSVTNEAPFAFYVGNYGNPDGASNSEDEGTQPIPAPSVFSVQDNIFAGWVTSPPRVYEGGYLNSSGTSFSFVPSTTYAINAGSNTIGATSILTNASTYDYTPVTPVSGSQNWTAYTYTHPTSTVARTDSYRGGVPSASTPSWVNNINVSEFGDIPLTNTMQDVTPSGLWNDITQADQSNSGTCWNDDYGPGGAMLLGGGGHTNSEYCYMWLFDGALPGFRALNLQLPARTYAAGSEWSYNASDMPGDAVLYEDKYYKPQWNQIQGYPWSPRMGYGEGETNIPTGFHWYNGWFAIPAGKMGMGAKGGFATVMKHSNTKASGIAVRWGHKIDANTGAWTRMSQEMPLGSGATNMLNNEKGYNRAVRLGDYAYHTFHEPLAARGIVRVNLNTGAYDLTVGCDSSQGFNQNSGSITGWDGIPGTTLLGSWAGNSDTPVSSGNPAVAGRFRVVDVDPSISNTARRYYSVNLTGDALPGGWGDTTVQSSPLLTNGMACVATMWVPEAGKFALFTTTDPTPRASDGQPVSTVFGAWPMALFWVTPPANLANWQTDPWVVTRENLTINASSTKALVEANRRPWGGSYQKCWWSSKLRRFVYIPRFSTGQAFFIRTSLVP